MKNNKYIVLKTQRTGYSADQCGHTLTIKELIKELEQYDEDLNVYYSNDNGYTYGEIREDYIEEEEEEEEEADDDE